MTPDELYTANEQLAYYVLNRTWPSLAFDEDMQQVAKIGLWKACKSYCAETSRFSTYAFRVIHNEILMGLRSARKESHKGDMLSIEAHMPSGKGRLADVIPGDKDIDSSGLLWETLRGVLTEREQEMVLLSVAGANQSEIARKQGVTRQSVCSAMMRARKKMRKRLAGEPVRRRTDKKASGEVNQTEIGGRNETTRP